MIGNVSADVGSPSTRDTKVKEPVPSEFKTSVASKLVPSSESKVVANQVPTISGLIFGVLLLLSPSSLLQATKTNVKIKNNNFLSFLYLG